MQNFSFDCSICCIPIERDATMCKICQKPICLSCHVKIMSQMRVCPHCKSSTEFIPIVIGDEILPAQNSLYKCEKHREVFLTLYCETCDQFICEKCLKSSKSHGNTHIVIKDEDEFNHKIEKIEYLNKTHKSKVIQLIEIISNEKIEKLHQLKSKHESTLKQLDYIMLNQKAYLKDKLNGVKDKDSLSLNNKHSYLSKLKADIVVCQAKAKRATNNLEKAQIYVIMKRLINRFNSLISDSSFDNVPMGIGDISQISNDNAVPPFYKQTLVFTFNLNENTVVAGNKPTTSNNISTETFTLYNCIWRFKMQPSNGVEIPSYDFIYKKKGACIEMQMKFVIEVLSNDLETAKNIVVEKEDILTFNICFGYKALIKKEVLQHYLKDNKLTINFYLRYNNYLDIIQDSLGIPNK